MGDPTLTDVLFGLLLMLFLSRLWWVVRRRHGSSWRTHVLAMLIGIIAALVIAFVPSEFLAKLNAWIDGWDRHR
jgi:hypothetical protein